MSAISSIADAITGALGITKPLVDDATAQKYEKAFTNRISEVQGILSTPDSDSRANALAAFTNGLLNDAGYPTAPGVQDNIAISVSSYLALISATAAKIKDDALLNQYSQKVNSV